VELLEQLDYPNSLALVSSAIAAFCGLESRPGEPLLSALATHGEPRHAQALSELLATDERGAAHLPADVFALPWSPSSGPGAALRRALGEPRAAGSRLRWEPQDRRDADVAASWQSALEESVLRSARELHARTGLADLCFGGELAWNSALVRRLALDGPFQRVCVPLDPGDAGAALGAALHASLELSGARAPLGACAAFALGEELRADAAPHARTLPQEAIAAEIARRLASGQLVGWLRGRAEWGARALGQRSLLVDASNASAVDRLRREVKRREAYVPFAPAVLEERAAEWFEVPPAAQAAARHMLVSARVHGDLAQRAPALVAGDGSARPQLVAREVDPVFHELLREFDALRGLPFVLHTSLNPRADVSVRSEPEALALMARSGLDALVVEDRIYEAGA
jgi:carbamoyltransferase